MSLVIGHLSLVDGEDGVDRVHVCSNDFSRCSRVMASAMTPTMSGLSACLGTGT
ncbi:hypothetical protein [Oscillatoria sp. HE19RPO]|uniref:hypothetical protein n=1 Tax=Oscillatoria sp. HE19RPO TaxID=2954806 RepID=UPI0020C20AC4|nr:hypothetical protein [Oscillatoria sp. HE19RPO]